MTRMSKQNRGREIREEGDARTRARESVEQAVLENVKRMEKTKGGPAWGEGKVGGSGGAD